MFHFSAAHPKCNMACRICTLVALLCLLTASLGTVPVLFSIMVPGNESPPEELETHSEVRSHCPRQLRLRFVQARMIKPHRGLCALKEFAQCSRPPQALFLPCFTGSGIRLLC